jgi:hypothetical protein
MFHGLLECRHKAMVPTHIKRKMKTSGPCSTPPTRMFESPATARPTVPGALLTVTVAAGRQRHPLPAAASCFPGRSLTRPTEPRAYSGPRLPEPGHPSSSESRSPRARKSVTGVVTKVTTSLAAPPVQFDPHCQQSPNCDNADQGRA